MKSLRSWLAICLVLQAALIGLRCWFGDVHGSLLMFSVGVVGVLALIFDDIADPTYCRYYGIMSLMSGLLDLTVTVELLGKHSFWHIAQGKIKNEATITLLIHASCAAAQLASAVFCYVVCQETDDEEQEVEGTIFATQEEARIYGAALLHSQWRGG